LNPAVDEVTDKESCKLMKNGSGFMKKYKTISNEEIN
jgi:hypothetical protein